MKEKKYYKDFLVNHSFGIAIITEDEFSHFEKLQPI
jgi:hypothetical protein